MLELLTVGWEHLQLNRQRRAWHYLLSAAFLTLSGQDLDLWWVVNLIGFRWARPLWNLSWTKSKKYQSDVFKHRKTAFCPNEILLVFWCCSEIFCRFWALFCINHFNDLQNPKHEKRLETDASSLRNPVIMRGIKLRLTFGDRCSTNWAIPLNEKCCVLRHAHLQKLWYHRHAVLSSVFQHKNAGLGKNLYSRMRCARHCRGFWPLSDHVFVAENHTSFSMAAMRSDNTKIVGKCSWHVSSDAL